MKKKKKKHQQNHQYKNYVNHHDVETTAELSPETVTGKTSRAKRQDEGGIGLGITALTLSILAIFFWSFILSSLGIILGIIGGQRGSKTGWWAVGIGVFVLLFRILTFPITAIFF